MSDVIAFHGEITEPIFVRVQKKMTGGSMLFFTIIGTLLLIATGFEAIFRGGSLGTPFIGLVFIALPLYTRWKVRDTYRRSKVLQRTLHGTVSEEAISVQSELGSSRIPWDMYIAQTMTKDLILLYQQPNQAQMLPRELFGSDSEWETVRRWTAEKVKPRRSQMKQALVWAVVLLVILILWSLIRR